MLTGLYLIIIQPIVYFLEFLFSWFHFDLKFNFLNTIILLSLVVSFLCLPFYLKAEKHQEEEKNIQKKMADKLNSIKRNYKGDERSLLIQTCYRQNNYHPIMSLRLSISLLLQIPFFIAAYTFFCNLSLLDGASVLIFKNLSKPDALLSVGSFSINVLPIIMTIVTLISGYIYTGTVKFKDNKNLYLISLIFLVLLYNSPSGLVLYWTYNNIFSCFKNACLKYGSPTILAVVIWGLITLFYFKLYISFDYKFGFLFLLFLFVIFFTPIRNKLYNIKFNFSPTKLFYLSAIFLWILLGFLIPTNVIASSPTEFLFSDKAQTYEIIFQHQLIYFGVFVFWGACLFHVLNKQEKNYFSLIYSIFGLILLLNLHILKLPDIPLLNDLTFDISPKFLVFNSSSINLSICYYLILAAIIFITVYLILKNRFLLLKNAFIILIVSMIIFASNNMYVIVKTYNDYKDVYQENNTIKLIKLSKTKKNVVFFFLDRTISSFFPLLMEELPELKKSFRGFNYYPNTTSFAKHSITGYPPMFGGYEYTPRRIDERKIDFLTKHNEAVTMLPVLFKNNGFESTIVHPVNKAWWQKASQNKNQKPIQYNDLFEKYKINILMPPKYKQNLNVIADETTKINLTKRNLAFFSLLSVLPEKSKLFWYDWGKYHSPIKTPSRAIYSQPTVQGYRELQNLVNYTDLSSDNNTFTIFCNWLMHEPAYFKLPYYEMDETQKPSIPNDKYTFFSAYTYKFYHTFAAGMVMMSKWLDYLKQEGVYDNTRIIIVSDHGYYGLKDASKSDFFNRVIFPVNPILLVKDFNSNEELKLNNFEPMTNADAPILAIKNIIDNPKNPFTGASLNMDDKKLGSYIQENALFLPKRYIGKDEVLRDVDIFSFVKGDPMVESNWRFDITKEELKKELNQD